MPEPRTEVKRYAHMPGGWMAPCETGDYVSYSALAEAEGRIAELREEVGQLQVDLAYYRASVAWPPTGKLYAAHDGSPDGVMEINPETIQYILEDRDKLRTELTALRSSAALEREKELRKFFKFINSKMLFTYGYAVWQKEDEVVAAYLESLKSQKEKP